MQKNIVLNSKTVLYKMEQNMKLPKVLTFYPKIEDMTNITFEKYVENMELEGAHRAGIVKVSHLFFQ